MGFELRFTSVTVESKVLVVRLKRKPEDWTEIRPSSPSRPGGLLWANAELAASRIMAGAARILRRRALSASNAPAMPIKVHAGGSGTALSAATP